MPRLTIHVLLLISLAAASAHAQSVNFVSLLSEGDPQPGYIGEGQGGRVPFGTVVGGNLADLFVTGTGGVTLIANTSTLAPHTGETFAFFGFAQLDGGDVYFRGSTSSTSGIYRYSSGTISRVVDSNMTSPLGPETFAQFWGPRHLDGSTYFLASTDDFLPTALYRETGGTITQVLGGGETLGGLGGTLAGSPRFYGWLTGRDHALVMVAPSPGNSTLGMVMAYTASGGPVNVVDTSVIAPGAGTPFTQFRQEGGSVDGDRIYFQGLFLGGSGVYGVDVSGANLARIADTSMVAPGRGTNFTHFVTPIADNGVVTFIGSYVGGQTLYLFDHGGMVPLLSTGDVLDGKTIQGITYNYGTFDEGLLTTSIWFSDGSSGLYQANLSAIPEPAAVGSIIGIGALACVLWRRRSERAGTRVQAP